MFIGRCQTCGKEQGVLRTLGNRPSGPAPLLGLRASRYQRVSESLMEGFAMLLANFSGSWGEVFLRCSVISRSALAREPSGCCRWLILAPIILFRFAWAKNALGTVLPVETIAALFELLFLLDVCSMVSAGRANGFMTLMRKRSKILVE